MCKRYKFFVFLAICVLFSFWQSLVQAQDTAWMRFIERDESGVVPRTITVGGLEWMTINLNVSRFENGDKIREAKTPEEWEDALKNNEPAWCYFENDPANGELLGKLYNIHAISDPRNLSLQGWRIPNVSDWKTLIDELGREAANKMKSTSGWKVNNGNNQSGMNLFPGGIRYGNGRFYGFGEYAVMAILHGEDKSPGYFYITDQESMIGGLQNKGADRHNIRGDGIYVRLVREKPYSGYELTPSGVPNAGILFGDMEETGRSSHMGYVLVESANGDLLSFYVNSSGMIEGGHLWGGWSEYRRSRDGGKTWGEAVPFPYSKAVWRRNFSHTRPDDANDRRSGSDTNDQTRGTDPAAMWEENITRAADEPLLDTNFDYGIVTSVVTAPDGTLVAFTSWGPEVVYHLSHDHGHTWSAQAYPLYEGENRPRFNYNNVFVHDNDIYALFRHGSNAGFGKLALYVSTDNGRSFEKRCDDIFPSLKDKRWYQAASVLDDGSFIVYVYEWVEGSVSPEEYMHYSISRDKGVTWSAPQKANFAKRLRNPQMSPKVGGYFFMVGRSGSLGPQPNDLVLYKSEDGVNWDEGIYLFTDRSIGVVRRAPHAYSAISPVGAYSANGPDRLLIQSSAVYSDCRVNIRHWWVHDIVEPTASRPVLWDGGKLPASSDIPLLPGVRFHVIKPYEYLQDGYRWLHGTALAWHGNRLYASFGHNRTGENMAGEEARGRFSSDGGRTWSEVFTIATGHVTPEMDGKSFYDLRKLDEQGVNPGENVGISHGVLLSHDGNLWSFNGTFGHTIHYNHHVRAYKLDEQDQKWTYMGRMLDNFWPMQAPRQMEDGNWIMAGVHTETNGREAAVAISHGNNLLEWDLVVIPKVDGAMWGESGVLLNGSRVISIARSGPSVAAALVAVSDDYGRTWTPSEPSNLPMASVKPSVGTLSTGQHYLISTTTADSGNRRAPLTIAVTRPGEEVFTKIWIIRHAVFPEGPGESHAGANLSYPDAVEHDGYLYVSYSNSGDPAIRVGEGRERANNNSAELAIIPITSLHVD